MRKGVGAEVTGSWERGSWRVVEQSRSPCPRGARHILEPAGAEGSAGGGAAASGAPGAGGVRGGPDRRGGGGQARGPGRRRRAPGARGERGLGEGRAAGTAQTRACGAGRSRTRTTERERSRLWEGVGRSEASGQGVVPSPSALGGVKRRGQREDGARA